MKLLAASKYSRRRRCRSAGTGSPPSPSPPPGAPSSSTRSARWTGSPRAAWSSATRPIEDATADLLLITHEHRDHNAAEAIGGGPAVIRSTAGTFDSPVGEVVAIASEHDDVAGTSRGPNSILRFTLGELRVCHLGDFGQPALRPEQRAAIGEVDVAASCRSAAAPTIGGAAAAQVLRDLEPAARDPDALPHAGGQLPRAAGRVPGGVRRPRGAARRERARRGRAAGRARRPRGRRSPRRRPASPCSSVYW